MNTGEVNSLMNQAAVEQRAKLRPLIDHVNGYYFHILDRSYPSSLKNTTPTIKMTRDIISIGCTDITPNAARLLIQAYDRHFNEQKEEIVIQP